MAFEQFKLDISSEQTRGIFNTYVYQTDDTSAEVQEAGYFIKSRFDLVDGDGCGALIRCCCSDNFFEGFTDSDGTITPVSDGAVVNIKEVSTPYTLQSTDEIVIVNGAGTVTVPDGFQGKTIYSVDGCTLSVTPENVPALIPLGQAYTIYYRASTGSYFSA